MAVYFMKRDGLVKIGTSVNPKRRASTIGARLVAEIPGDVATERAFHAMFADDRAEGEWFLPSGRLLALVDALSTRLPSPTEGFNGYERQVDPLGTLDPVERNRRAEAALKAYMTQLGHRSGKARRKKT